MRDALLLLIIFASSYLAFGYFALGQSRHWQAAVSSVQLSHGMARLLRTMGGILLALSCATALLHEGVDYGALLFGTIVSIAALGIALTLAW